MEEPRDDAADDAVIPVVHRPRIFRDRTNPLDMYDDKDIFFRFRMSRDVLLGVTDMLQDQLMHPTNRSHAIPPYIQIMCALRYYATGSMQRANGDNFGISQSSVSRIVDKVSNLLAAQIKHFVKFPTGPAQHEMKEAFYQKGGIPNVLGCVDGTFIPIKPPPIAEDVYVCRKQYHALNVQGVCDHRNRFTDIVIRWPGSTHDAFIFNQSSLNRKLQQRLCGNGYLLGDSAYPLRPWLLTPVREPRSVAEEHFNRHHSRIRKIIEDTFGRWKMRWQCLHKRGGSIAIKTQRSVNVIAATAVLHNICEERRIPIPAVEQDEQLYQNEDEADFNIGHNNMDRGEMEGAAAVRNLVIRERFT